MVKSGQVIILTHKKNDIASESRFSTERSALPDSYYHMVADMERNSSLEVRPEQSAQMVRRSACSKHNWPTGNCLHSMVSGQP